MTFKEELEHAIDYEVTQEDISTFIVTTPFADIMDDNIFIVVQEMANGLLCLTDCGNTLLCNWEHKDLAQNVCNRHRLILYKSEIKIYSRRDELKEKLNRIVIALKEISDELRRENSNERDE